METFEREYGFSPQVIRDFIQLYSADSVAPRLYAWSSAGVSQWRCAPQGREHSSQDGERNVRERDERRVWEQGIPLVPCDPASNRAISHDFINKPAHAGNHVS